MPIHTGLAALVGGLALAAASAAGAATQSLTILHDNDVHGHLGPREQARQAGDRGQLRAAGRAPLEVGGEGLALRRVEGTQDVHADVEAVRAAHDPTPISSSARRSARSP